MTLNCLIFDLDSSHSEELRRVCEAEGFETAVYSDITEMESAVSATGFDVAFLDIGPVDTITEQIVTQEGLSDTEIIVMAGADEPARADAAIRQGATHFFCKPFDAHHITALLGDIREESANNNGGSFGDEAPGGLDQFGYLRGSSRPMRKLYRVLRKVGPTTASVLIIGESGSGKELVASTLHALSERSENPYIAFNCGAVAENLVESEMFGHEKGSFSGADRKHRGFFERAHGGTLFLDEITEMDTDLQVKLLRVLETGLVRRIGSERDIPLDVRIIAATNRDPETAVAAGVLREDLYYRLAQFPVRVPPLRRRDADIVGLAQHFLNELNERYNTSLTFSPQALEALSQNPWPGNVRQLKHAVERSYIISEKNITETELPEVQVQRPAGITHNPTDAEIIVPIGTSLAECEKALILATIEYNDGDKKLTAAQLGISLKTLYNRLKSYSDMGGAEGDSSAT